MTALSDICHFLPLLFVWYFPLYSVVRFVSGVVLSDYRVHQIPRTKVPRWPSSSDTAQFITSILHLSSDGNFVHSSAGCPWIFVCPHIGYWAGPFLTHSLNTGQNWPTQIPHHPYQNLTNERHVCKNNYPLTHVFQLLVD